jgi:hypothetical protein
MIRIFRVALFVFSLFPARPALAAFECSADYVAGFDERLLAGDCELVHEAPIRGPHGRSTLYLVRYAGPSHGDDAWIPMADELAARVGAALTEMGGVRLQDRVEVFLVPETLVDTIPGTSQTGPIHGTLGGVTSSVCQLAMYKLPTGASTEEFVFTLAHEIFHCVQYATWHDSADTEAATWWVEGSAEYFANLALPGTDFSSSHVASFDPGILDRSLVDLAYPTVVFFAWLGQTGGAGAIPELIGAMPSTGGANGQLAALADVVPDDRWRAFAEDYLSGRVQLPGGTEVPEPTAIRGFVDFPLSPDVEYRADAYQIDRIDMTFARDHTFQLNDAPNGLLTGAKGPEGGYAPLPTSVDTCDGQKRYRHYATTTEPAGPGRLTVEVPELGPGACCLTGNWQPTTAALNGLVEFAGAQGVSCTYKGGGWLLSFRPDGTGRIEYDGYSHTCSDASGRMRVDSILSGLTEFTWVTTSTTAAKLTFVDHSMAQSLKAKIGPANVDLSGDYPGPATDRTGMAYACEGDSLTAIGMFNLFTEQKEHTRVAP